MGTWIGRDYYATRDGRETLVDVTFRIEAARLLPEALGHVANSVFEVFDDEDDDPGTLRGHRLLSDAKTAAKAALVSAKGPEVTVSVSSEEAAMIPEALRHVANQIFDDGSAERRLLREAAEAVGDALPGRAGPGR